MKEWGTAHGLHHAVATLIQPPSNDIMIFQFQRRIGQAPFEADERSKLDFLRPHLARAAFLSARWRMEKLKAVGSALAALGLPAAVLDARGKVIAANDLVGQSRSYLTWLPNERASLGDPISNELLRNAIATITAPAAAEVRSIPIRPPGEGEPAVAHLIPTTGWARDFFLGGHALLVVTPLSRKGFPLEPTLLQGLFDLTPSEAKVADSIAQGMSLPKIAKQNGVSHETVRSQAKSVFVKTGTAGQSELAALLSKALLFSGRRR